ncbi:Proline synthetase co-transcribed protein [Phaffia rhodozyma]|uniref:Pyridoxal phosphate homeostasis protein n=1 Tax=Phaffia rhodozyma TaxID=264483 RepID=A0A0F7SK02_PHARH|nr:Proline synthetase co-transcribed protein [Phaffia rhodozyma]
MSNFPQPSAERTNELKDAIKEVEDDVKAINDKALLVAVSKLKPSSDIMALYNNGYRHFGENYIQELSDKAKELPTDIHWHFIGSLQSNKVKFATAIPNLFVLETLDSIKKADLIEKSLSAENSPRSSPLNVYIQINTSGEDNKSGVAPLSKASSTESREPKEAVELAMHIIKSCPHIHILGLMTIGSWDASHTKDETNPDFVRLVETREQLVAELKKAQVEKDKVGRPGEDWRLELSMGMSADFKGALQAGSDSVRVGTSIFGARPPKRSDGSHMGRVFKI